MINSAVLTHKTEYKPKYFTSRKVSLVPDIDQCALEKMKLETSKFETPVKSPLASFAKIPVAAMSDRNHKQE